MKDVQVVLIINKFFLLRNIGYVLSLKYKLYYKYKEEKVKGT